MQTPFLRGILTSSLLDAGVEFELAYDLASKIRHQINDHREISTTELRNIVVRQLEDKSEAEVIEIFLKNKLFYSPFNFIK